MQRSLNLTNFEKLCFQKAESKEVNLTKEFEFSCTCYHQILMQNLNDSEPMFQEFWTDHFRRGESHFLCRQQVGYQTIKNKGKK
tara:strand:+ start:366 stop:617 length:252 start_codon:yes stop_codon:yes gene_type:complete